MSDDNQHSRSFRVSVFRRIQKKRSGQKLPAALMEFVATDRSRHDPNLVFGNAARRSFVKIEIEVPEFTGRQVKFFLASQRFSIANDRDFN